MHSDHSKQVKKEYENRNLKQLREYQTKYGAQKLNPTSGKNWKEPRGFLIIEEYTQQL